MTIELTPDLEILIEERARQTGVDPSALASRLLREALERLSCQPAPAVRRQTISERFDAIRRQLSPEERQALDELPPDFAAEHDHYIYGSPKRDA